MPALRLGVPMDWRPTSAMCFNLESAMGWTWSDNDWSVGNAPVRAERRIVRTVRRSGVQDGIRKDIREQGESHAVLSAIVEAFPEPLALLDGDLVIVNGN